MKLTFLPMKITVDVSAGTTVLEAAHLNNLPLEGACEASLACSTCHVIVSEQWFDKLDPASDEEEDILDRAFDLQPTSRLGCQIVMTDLLDGLEVTIPEYTVNVSLDKRSKLEALE